jgi:hypothetical protein
MAAVVDPGTGMAVLGSAPVVLKIVGPTADYVGGGIKNLVERQVENVEAIFANAADKLGEEGLNKPGAVPPRVLKEIIEGGSFCEEPLSTEYFGGILASSKSEQSRDDRGATLAALVGRLSTYQLRCHYLMYAHGQRLLLGSGLELGVGDQRHARAQFFMPISTWIEGMGFSDDERERFESLAAHCGPGLMREDLVGDRFGSGNAKSLQGAFGRDFEGVAGIVYELTILGIELFMAAHGKLLIALPGFVDPDHACEVNVDVDLDGDVVPLGELPSTARQS